MTQNVTMGEGGGGSQSLTLFKYKAVNIFAFRSQQKAIQKEI